jgi:hypothetical protein
MYQDDIYLEKIDGYWYCEFSLLCIGIAGSAAEVGV